MNEKLLYGVGVKDVSYTVEISKVINGESVKVWRCPYYAKWVGMLSRCYAKTKYKTYEDCSVCDDWLKLSTFKEWVDSQPNRNWANCHLDKDILMEGNKVYSPENCVFVTGLTNSFILCRGKGTHMLGAMWNKKKELYRSQCADPFKLQSPFIGYFKTELEAHKAWQARKHVYALQLAELQEDPRVMDVLRTRYSSDKDLTIY